MNSAFIGLGSNIGDRLKNLRQAIYHLTEINQIEIVNISSVYESEPMYFEKQNSFYNAVVEIATDMDPVYLLMKLKEIEHKMGRDTTMQKNGPRIIDLDIEFFDDLVLETEMLEIPHPGLYERLFVLQPLCELDKSFKCCKTGKTVKVLMEDCPDKSKIKKIGKIEMMPENLKE